MTSNSAEYQRRYYHLNKHRYKESRKERNKREYQRARRFVMRQKLMRGKCAVCYLECHQGNLHHFEWDHRDPDDKAFNVADGHRKALRVLGLEIEKCDLLCLFCHRDRTIAEGHWSNRREAEPDKPWTELQLFETEE